MLFDHPNAVVAQQFCDLSRGDTVRHRVSRICVAKVVADEVTEVGELLSESSEAAANGIPRERTTKLMAWKERPLGTFNNELAGEFQHRRIKVHNPGLACPLRGFVAIKHPDAEVQMHVCGSQPSDFRRPATRLHECKYEVAELVVADGREDFGLFRIGQYPRASARRRLIYIPQRVWGKDTLFVRPIESALNRDDCVFAFRLSTQDACRARV